MAVAFDAVGPSGGTGASSGTPTPPSTSPLTWTHVLGSSANAIIIGVTSGNGGTNLVTGVTVGGQACTLLGYVASGGITAGGIALYYLLNPPTGSQTVSAAFTGTAAVIGGSVSYTGVGSIGSPVTNIAVSSGSVTASVPSTTTGGMISAAACVGTVTTFAGTNSVTLRWNLTGDSSTAADNACAGDVASTGGGASQTVGFSNAASDDWGIVAVELIPPGSAATSSGAMPQPGSQNFRRRHRRRQVPWFNMTAAPPSLTVNAGLASGTGAAFGTDNGNLAAGIAPNAGLATGAGAAGSPTAGTAPNAGLATGTGAALGADNSSLAAGIGPVAGLASGAGAAGSPVPGVGVAPGLATGVGAAFNPAVAGPVLNVTAGLASGTGAAFGPVPGVGAASGLATGAGAAFGPVPGVGAVAGLATGAGAAFGPVPGIAPKGGLASGAGSAFGPGAGNRAAGLASGAGAAFAPGAGSRLAGLASGAGAAGSPAIASGVRPPENLGGNITLIALGGSAAPVAYDGSAVTVANTYGGGAVMADFADGSLAVVTYDGTAASIANAYGGTLALTDYEAATQGWTMQQVALTLAENNDETVSVALTQNGTALNLTGATVNMYLKTAAGTPDGSALVLSSGGGSPAITITNAAGGLCSVAIPKADLTSETYTFYRIDVVFSGLQNTAIYGGITWITL